MIEGANSAARLATCHPDLAALVREVAEHRSLIVLCGHRGRAEQDACFARGTSKLRWPRSKHNAFPSLAVDLAPYPLDWTDIAAFKALGALVLATASRLRNEGKIASAIRWGGHFTGFPDYPHYEISTKKGDHP